MLAGNRILGIDFGSKRIGIAMSDPLQVIAQGFKVIPNTPDAPGMIKKIVEEYGIGKIVIGMPLNLKGDNAQKAEEVEEFIRRLVNICHTDIVRWDERFTSTMAHQTLRMMGATKKQRQSKEKIDEMASALILQGFLDSARR